MAGSAKVKGESSATENSEREVLGEDTSATLSRPVQGSCIPISTGYRRCIGRRFTQVELLAVSAVLVMSSSLELDMGEFAGDTSLEGRTAQAKRKIYTRAGEKMWREL